MRNNLCVYQIFYKEEQKSQLFLDTIPYYNKNLHIYFENEVILKLYQEGKIRGDLFGVLSWKARKKNHIRRRKLSSMINNRFGMYSFTYDRHDVLGYADLCHPGFSEIFHELLLSLGLDPEIKPMVGLYQNAVIAEPTIYIDYIENFLIPAMEFLDNSSGEYKRLLYSDAAYRGISEEKLQEAFGIDHYPHHTFILERLWSIFFQAKRKKKTARYFMDKVNPKVNKSTKVNSKGKLHKFNL